MTDDLEDDAPIPAIRQAMETAPEPDGMDSAIMERIERRSMFAWFLELFVVVFGWVVSSHLDFAKSIGTDTNKLEDRPWEMKD